MEENNLNLSKNLESINEKKFSDEDINKKLLNFKKAPKTTKL